MRKALVVDNSLMVLKVMTDILSGFGIEVRTARDGLEALKVLDGYQADILFVDLIMPNFDGDKLCRVIRKSDRLRNSFIAILSGVAAEQKIDCTKFGANLCIAKGPFRLMGNHVKTALDLAEKHGNTYSSPDIIGLEDIYEREVTKELLSSKKHFEGTINHLDEGFLELNETGHILYMNPAAAALLGKEEELLSVRFASIFSPEGGRLIENVLASLGEQPVVIGKHPLFEHAGRNLMVHFLPVNETDQRSSILVIIHDVTERIKEEALRERESKYRQLFDENTDAVIIFDVETCLIEEVNAAAETLLGHSRSQLLEMCIDDILAEAEKKTGAATRLRPDGAHAVHLPEMLIRRRNGSIFPAEMLAGSFMTHQRRKIIVSIRNIEKRKKLEQDLRQSHKMEAIGTLAGGIAHDFNNILTAIMAHAELAMQRLGPDNDTIPGLKEIIKASTRAKELVGQILTFSRTSDHAKNPLEVYLVLTEAMKLIRATTPASVEIRTRINRKSGVILADPTQIHQLLMNLCANAVDAMAGKGFMEIELDRVDLANTGRPDIRPGVFLRLTVRDSGHGMDEATRQRIFEPFFTTKDVGKGTGMGLSVVHGVVTAHNGFIEVETEQGQGTAFHVYFPATEQTPLNKSVVAAPLPEGREKILLIDDELSILKGMQTFLSVLGYTVVICSRGKAGLDCFLADPDSFDLVVTDQAMPDLTGDELARRFLALRPELPIILVTGYSASIDEAKAKKIGIREYLLKPFLPGQLARLIRKHLEA